MVREAMLNPEVDAEKAKVMAELMTNLEDRALKAEFNRAKNAAIMEMPVITKDGRIVIRDKNNQPSASRAGSPNSRTSIASCARSCSAIGSRSRSTSRSGKAGA
jgi:hypothetical protein